MRAHPAQFEELDIFRTLGAEDRARLAAHFEYRVIPGGERLICEGDAAEALYIVISGRFEVRRAGGPALAVIGRGEPVGEVAFFGRARRTADVTALRDSEVLAMRRADFDTLADEVPILWRGVLSALSDRLATATADLRPERRRPAQPRSLVLCPAGSGKVSREFAFRLVDALIELGTAACLLDEDTVCVATGSNDIDAPEVSRWLTVHESAHDLVIWLASGDADPWARKAVRYADAALMIAEGSPKEQSAIEALVTERLDRADIRIALIDGKGSDWTEGRAVAAIHPARSDAEIAVLARFLCGRARGLVLGGGGALCGAHVGLVFALRKIGIDFDSFAGTSAGGAVAAALAMGFDRAEIVHRVKDIFLTNRALKRWTIPRYGMIDAATVDRMLQRHFGLGDIADLPHPFLTIATDLADNATHVMDRGSLWQAVRATCSVPILLPPFIDEEGRILVDGGITDNLPIDPLRSRQRGPVLAVMLGSARWQRAAYRYDQYPSRGALILDTLLPWRRTGPKAPRLGQIMTRSMLLSSDGASHAALERADLVFAPPLPKRMGITDWKRFERLELASYDWASKEIARRLEIDPTAFDAFR